MRPVLTIDGTDFSYSVNKYGYRVSYSPIAGSNGGIMLDGSEVVDILAWKAFIELPCNGMKGSDMAALVAACRKSYVTVTYYDIATNGNRTSVFIPELGGGTYRMTSNSGEMCFDGLSIALREK